MIIVIPSILFLSMILPVTAFLIFCYFGENWVSCGKYPHRIFNYKTQRQAHYIFSSHLEYSIILIYNSVQFSKKIKILLCLYLDNFGLQLWLTDALPYAPWHWNRQSGIIPQQSDIITMQLLFCSLLWKMSCVLKTWFHEWPKIDKQTSLKWSLFFFEVSTFIPNMHLL